MICLVCDCKNFTFVSSLWDYPDECYCGHKKNEHADRTRFEAIRTPGDKTIFITDAKHVFAIEIDYDDVDHEQIDFYLEEFVAYLNRWKPENTFVRSPREDE